MLSELVAIANSELIKSSENIFSSTERLRQLELLS
jgi:hypothetical protein